VYKSSVFLDKYRKFVASMIDPRYRNALMAYIAQQPQPVNMLAAADDGFDPNGPIAQMLRAQRAAEAARAAQAQKAPKPQPRPSMIEPAESVLQRRMREAGVQ
jgi:hypothetical protein